MSNFHTKIIVSLFCGLLMFAANPSRVSADEPLPAWLSKAATSSVPNYPVKDVPAVVLYNEQVSTLDATGKLTVTENYAVKVLTKEGKYLADAAALYLQSASKVRDLKGWLIRPNGSVKFYGKESTTDAVSDMNDIYNEYRVKMISARDDADVGYIFGYQSVTEEKPLFTEDFWVFQDLLPTLVARYSLNLPSGWEAKSMIFNRDNVAPSVNGTSYTWELRDLQPIPLEDSSPSTRRLSPTLAVRYYPTSKTGTRIFENWEEVSRWGSEMHAPQVIVDDAVAKKARELTANVSDEFEKIRAIASYVQNLQYISVDIGVAYGNGYRPRPSNTVLARGYGDCKDKANLMRAMLKSLNIESYPIFIFSGDPTFVRAEWSSPRQFNHCIIAIKVGDTVQSEAVINHAKLGRLLIFDATDPHTVLGDFPDHEQGSFAVIAAGENGGLAEMPKISAKFNQLERRSQVVIDDFGNLSGKIVEKSTGQTATKSRRSLRGRSAADFNKSVESRLNRTMNGIKIKEIVTDDKFADGRFDLQIDFAAPSYAQLMQNRLMVFKPTIISRLDRMYFQEDRRIHPYLMDATSYTETVDIKIPNGFIVDEMPEPSDIKTEFGDYSTNFEVKDNLIVFKRSLTIRKAVVTPEKFDAMRKFFGALRYSEDSPIVLLKK